MEKKGRLHGVFSIVGILLCIVFGGLLIANVTIIIKGVINPNSPPSVLGVTPMVVQSGSMSGNKEGHIEVGDLIFVGSVDKGKLKTGDVVSYMKDKIVITHRIMSISKDGKGNLSFVTKGDANNAPDREQVRESQIIGIYKFRVARIGDLAMFLQTPMGMAIFMGIPICGFIIYDIIRRKRDRGKQAMKTAELEAEIERLKSISETHDENA